MIPRFEKRVRAFSIDIAGMMLALILMMFVKPLIRNIILGVVFILIFIVPYFISSGQTFGKRIQKIKVVMDDGRDINVLLAILRQLFIIFASLITFGIYLIIAFFAMTEKNSSKTIHDYIFKTKMIDLNPVRYKDDVLGKTQSMRNRGL